MFLSNFSIPSLLGKLQALRTPFSPKQFSAEDDETQDRGAQMLCFTIGITPSGVFCAISSQFKLQAPTRQPS